ncbi:MAG: hypothetical protein JNN30_06355 [Rhodanobacteraceae bacterium]|nr:hypothetical protein [Rhodanobacteraceae bacterium]
MNATKQRAAIAAIQGLVIQARLLAYGRALDEQIADLLDQCEYLPGLLLKQEDHSATFGHALRDIANRFPSCRYAADQYEAATAGI